MADGIFTTNAAAARPRKANECIMSVKHLKPPENLFDEFWREGELALLFGPSGTGKSILAMQLAEAIARGRGIDGFAMSEKRRKVLYVDLKFSERQFGMRYTNEGKQYKLSENLYHDKPEPNEDLCTCLRRMIRENGFRVVVIDDLSAVRQTYDGTRETLKLMRELKLLKDELDVSILVLASSQEQRRGELISEAHMMRSRVLCDTADSVFAVGVHAGDPQWRYLVQTRSLGAARKWVAGNVPVCSIQRSEDGFLGFIFDERFVAEIDQETREMILNVKWAHDAGASFRDIADQLGISRSKAFRMCKKWTPDLEEGLVFEPEDEEILAKIVADNRNKEEKFDLRSYEAKDPYPMDISAIPFLAALKRISITDLKRDLDAYGRERFILKEQNDGKPMIWYQYDAKGKFVRKERDSWGITIKRVEEPWISSVTRCENLT